MKEVPFANALAFVAAIFYIICALGIAFARDAYIAFVNIFFHGIDLTALPVKETSLTNTVIGFIVLVFASWVLGYLFAYCYNWCTKRFK